MEGETLSSGCEGWPGRQAAFHAFHFETPFQDDVFSATLVHSGDFNWDFVTAKVAVPLLGSDFLCTYGLLVDVKNHRLINALTFCSYACTPDDSDSVNLSSLLSVCGRFPAAAH